MAKKSTEKAVKKQPDLFGAADVVPAAVSSSTDASQPKLMEFSAGQLLSCATSEQASAELAVAVNTEVVVQLLNRFPPELVKVGRRWTMVGNVKFSCALLKCVPAEQVVKPQLLTSTVPFWDLELSLDSLLVEPDIPVRIQSFINLVQNLTGKQPSLKEIGAAHNRTPSAIGKILRNKASE